MGKCTRHPWQQCAGCSAWYRSNRGTLLVSFIIFLASWISTQLEYESAISGGHDTRPLKCVWSDVKAYKLVPRDAAEPNEMTEHLAGTTSSVLWCLHPGHATRHLLLMAFTRFTTGMSFVKLIQKFRRMQKWNNHPDPPHDYAFLQPELTSLLKNGTKCLLGGSRDQPSPIQCLTPINPIILIHYCQWRAAQRFRASTVYG